VENFLALLEDSALATHLRSARWEYAAVSAGHIFGIALLIGAILPLDLRLLGFWSTVERRTIARVLVPVAASGLLVAVGTGLLLLSVRAQEYASLTVLKVKLLLILIGILSAFVTHLRHGLWLDRSPSRSLAGVGVLSLAVWICALACGRLIAFV